MAWDDSMYGNRQETACIPLDGTDLAEQLAAAMQNITGQITEVELVLSKLNPPFGGDIHSASIILKEGFLSV